MDDSDLRKAVAELDLDVAGRMQLLPRGDVLWVNDSYNANPHLSEAYCRAYVRCIPLDDCYLQQVRWQNLETKPLSYIIKWACLLLTVVSQPSSPVAPMPPNQQRAGKRPQRLVHVTEEPDDLFPLLQRTLQPNDVILVKGSRSARMERILPE